MSDFDFDDAVKRTIAEQHDRIAALEAENAKLRELVVKMFHTIECSDRMSDSMYWPSFFYERELRELGVDVDG